MDSRQSQSGIPMILLVVALVVAFAAPRLPVMFRKGLLIAGMLVWIGGFCYIWKRIVFLLLAGVLGITAGGYVTATPGTAY
jgi:hypothetical protein